MNDPVTRAAAIGELIREDRHSTAVGPLPEAIVACCEDLVRSGESALALSLTSEAATILGAADEGLRLRSALVQVNAEIFLGRYEAAYARCRELTAGQSAAGASRISDPTELRISEAHCLWLLNRSDEAIERLQGIRSELLRLPDSALLSVCSVQLSSAEMRRGEFESARRFALDAVVSARRSEDAFHESVALNNFGQIERTFARWSSAEEACSEALRIALANGFRHFVNHSRRSLAIIHWKRGRLDASDEMASVCVREAAAVSAGAAEWYASLLKGMILLHRGAFREAAALFTRKDGWEVPRAESRPSLLTTEFLGDVQLEQGKAEAALRHYDEVWPEALALVPKGDIVAELRRRRAECYLLLGRNDEALQEALIGLEHCRELGDRYEEAAVYRVLGMAAAAVGKPAEAKRWFDQGFAYYDDIETPYEWGKLWMAYGDWLRGPQAGEHADARGGLEAYHAARDHFERMGAAAKLAEAEARIASLAAMGAAATSGVGVHSSASGVEAVRPPRRPRGSAELDHRAAWARETFGFVTRNRVVLDLLAEVSKLAGAGAPMLILGESGTGKELIAHGVHRLSGRPGAFVPINCGALPRDVIESELFGHVAGAFTGATRDKPGLLEVCDRGTAFLDEIAEMSIELQARLLRFLETGELRRVGANRNLAVDTLVIAATNRDRASLEKGEGFRPDLYYRLAHAVVVLPPLRRRGEDVDLLVSHFLEQACREQGKTVRLSSGARNRLIAHAWPGNVRQLRAVLKRLVILAAPEHEIAADEVPLDDSDVAATLSEELEQAERRRMVEALAQARGSRSDAARALGMARTTFVTKMKRYGIR